MKIEFKNQSSHFLVKNQSSHFLVINMKNNIIIILFNMNFVTCVHFKYLNKSANEICKSKDILSNDFINSNIAICLNNNTKLCITMFNYSKIYIYTPRNKYKLLIDDEVLYHTYNILPVFCFNNDIYLISNNIYIFDKTEMILKKIYNINLESKININTTVINYDNFGFTVEYKNKTTYYCKYSNDFISYLITTFKKPINEIELKDIVRRDFLTKKKMVSNTSHLRVLIFIFPISIIVIVVILIFKKRFLRK